MWLGAFVVWASIPASLVLLVSLSPSTCHTDSSVKLLSVSASGARFGPVGYELDLLYLAALLLITLQGPGPLSIDHMLRPKFHIVKDACSQSLTASRTE